MSIYINSPTIRACQPEDENRLLEICHITGDISIDRYLFGLRWCLYYLWFQSENSFVAVDSTSELVLGYILGALDTAVQEQHFQDVMVPKIKQYWQSIHPKSLKTWDGYIKLRLSETSIFKELYPEYPAHLHINIDPAYQRRGLGHLLIQAYEDNLTQHNIPGYHLIVGADNQAGIAFYHKIGLTKLQKFPGVGKNIVLAFGKKLSSA
jgi:ribosomal protein S18 acetylase RimI-like enzyme